MKPTILIVEDEPAIVDTIQYALETDGFDTLCLSAGQPALAVLQQQPIDLIVLDIGLPDVTGLELCKQIRETHDTPIIFLTARADEIDRVVGLEIGGDDYVTKPFSPRELTARVRAILRRVSPAVALTGNPQVLTIDASKRKIFYHGQELELSLTEYRLLRVFMERPGHVFSRERLMDRVWDEPEASMDRTVDAHVKNLRFKLKSIRPEVDPIVTHRGAGYALREVL